VSKEIVVALIAVSGVVLTQFVTYVLGRQARRDLRANIDREIDILRKLRPESNEAGKLEKHITWSIDDLIWRDERRERLSNVGRNFGPLLVIGWALWALGIWRNHGVPKDLSSLITSVYWGLFANFVLIGGLLIWDAGKYAYWRVRFAVAKVRGWFLDRKLAKLGAQAKALNEHGEAIEAVGRQRIQAIMAIRDQVIAKLGQEEWDPIARDLAEFEALLDARPKLPEPPAGLAVEGRPGRDSWAT
jgi:hypothetical protein